MPRVLSIERLAWRDAHLADIALPAGTMRLTRSLASGLTRRAGDPPGVFWGVGDRGPNIKPRDAANRYGVEAVRHLAAHDGAKIMPLLAAGPCLARFRLDGDAICFDAAMPLSDAAGRPVSGLPTPYGAHAEVEAVFDLAGAALPTDPGGVDSEGIAALPDGGFWIAEEYGPSLLRVDGEGRVLVRWVPVGTGALHAGAPYPVVEVLPALAAARKLNRGFEGVAATPDGTALFVAFQSPLAHPTRAAHERSRHVRVWRLSGATGALEAEYVYPLDDPGSFARDAAHGPVDRGDIKISELQLLPDGSLLVLERATETTKIYRVRPDPAHIAPPSLSDPATRPTLEQMGDLGDTAVLALTKQLLLTTDDWPAVSPDLEGMVLLEPDTLLLSNDSDFGVEGAETKFWRVIFDAPLA